MQELTTFLMKKYEGIQDRNIPRDVAIVKALGDIGGEDVINFLMKKYEGIQDRNIPRDIAIVEALGLIAKRDLRGDLPPRC